MNETTPRAIGLGAARPGWCPPAEVPRDPCEIKYPVDIPIIGVEQVGVPVYRIVYDAMQAGTKFLPEYLPQVWQQLQPYIGQLTDHAVRTIESEADYLAEKLLDEQVMPRVDVLHEELIDDANELRDELLVTILAVGAASILCIGLAAWWINERERQRDAG